MNHRYKYIRNRIIKKAKTSVCRYKIGAIGLNNKGEIINSSTNSPRFAHIGGSIHAEMAVMLKAGPSLSTILICRVGAGGDILPIHPCKVCAKKAKKLGITIVPIER